MDNDTPKKISGLAAEVSSVVASREPKTRRKIEKTRLTKPSLWQEPKFLANTSSSKAFTKLEEKVRIGIAWANQFQMEKQRQLSHLGSKSTMKIAMSQVVIPLPVKSPCLSLEWAVNKFVIVIVKRRVLINFSSQWWKTKPYKFYLNPTNNQFHII